MGEPVYSCARSRDQAGVRRHRRVHFAGSVTNWKLVPPSCAIFTSFSTENVEVLTEPRAVVSGTRAFAKLNLLTWLLQLSGIFAHSLSLAVPTLPGALRRRVRNAIAQQPLISVAEVSG